MDLNLSSSDEDEEAVAMPAPRRPADGSPKDAPRRSRRESKRQKVFDPSMGAYVVPDEAAPVAVEQG